MAIAAVASHHSLDPAKVIDAIMDRAVPPLSPLRKLEKDTEAAIAILKSIAPKRESGNE